MPRALALASTYILLNDATCNLLINQMHISIADLFSENTYSQVTNARAPMGYAHLALSIMETGAQLETTESC